MSVADIFEERSAFSFEVFPPKTDVGMEKLCGAGGVLEQLYTLNPDYISCTYGAGGTNVGKNLEVLDKIQKDGKCTPVTHFTCIGNTREGIKEQLQTYLDHGIDHMLALRGDLPFGWTGTGGDLHYATELVKFVRKEFGDKFTIAVAGSPEGHIACRSLEADIGFLKQKQDEGADYIMTQLCWDMDQFKYQKVIILRICRFHLFAAHVDFLPNLRPPLHFRRFRAVTSGSTVACGGYFCSHSGRVYASIQYAKHCISSGCTDRRSVNDNGNLERASFSK